MPRKRKLLQKVDLKELAQVCNKYENSLDTGWRNKDSCWGRIATELGLGNTEHRRFTIYKQYKRIQSDEHPPENLLPKFHKKEDNESTKVEGECESSSPDISENETEGEVKTEESETNEHSIDPSPENFPPEIEEKDTYSTNEETKDQTESATLSLEIFGKEKSGDESNDRNSTINYRERIWDSSIDLTYSDKESLQFGKLELNSSYNNLIEGSLDSEKDGNGEVHSTPLTSPNKFQGNQNTPEISNDCSNNYLTDGSILSENDGNLKTCSTAVRSPRKEKRIEQTTKMSNESPEEECNVSEVSLIDDPDYSISSNLLDEENESGGDDENGCSTPSTGSLPEKVLSESELNVEGRLN